jgi:hypothetical protein
MNRVRIYHRAQQLLPAAIQTAGLHGVAMSSGQLRYLLFGLLLGRESRGAIALELARHAVDAIQHEGLAYFDGATCSRGALSGGALSYYEAWRHLSPEGQGGHAVVCGEWMGTAHDDIAPGRWRSLEASLGDGAYLTREVGRDAWLAVLPTARLVVYGWRDR